MKIFAIRNEHDLSDKNLAYLFYYEKSKAFNIEIPDNCDAWDVPLIISSFAKRNELTVDSHWSKIWVQQRIIPQDRQNLGQILKENNLKEYDEYELLMLSKGRCEQDDYYLVPINEKDLPISFKIRNDKKIEFVIPLDNYDIIVFFRNGTAKKCNVKKYFDEISKCNTKYRDAELFKKVRIIVGGYGLTWGNLLNISNNYLFDNGKEIPLTIDDFKCFISEELVNSSEAAELLNCSRQNIDDLVKRGKLRPVKQSEKNKLFLKDEVLRREWE